MDLFRRKKNDDEDYDEDDEDFDFEGYDEDDGVDVRDAMSEVDASNDASVDTSVDTSTTDVEAIAGPTDKPTDKPTAKPTTPAKPEPGASTDEAATNEQPSEEPIKPDVPPVPVPAPVPVPEGEPAPDGEPVLASDLGPDTGDGNDIPQEGGLPPGGDDATDIEEYDFGDDTDEYLDDGDDEEGESKLAALMAKKWIRLSVYATAALIIIAMVSGGAIYFLGGGEELAENTESPTQAAVGGLQPPSGLSLNDEAAVEGESIDAERAQAGITAFETSGGLNAASEDPAALGSTMVQVASRNSYSRYPDREIKEPLSKAPDRNLIEMRGETELPLPKIGNDGELSWEVYGRPSDVPPEILQVSVVITELGLGKTGTLAAIRKLPPEVSLSFSPYAEELDQWMIRSRRAGHEVMIGLPLETSNFPIEDHGPLALKLSNSTEENITKLENILQLLQGSIGVEVLMGSAFTANAGAVRDMLNMLNSRGLMILDSKISPITKIPDIGREMGSAVVVSDIRLDSVMASSAINARIKDAERLLKSQKRVVVTTSMTPAIMERLQLWFASLHAMGAVLVPVSSFANPQRANNG